MKSWHWVLIGSIILLLDVGFVSACSCLPSPPVLEAVNSSDYVFSGVVIDSRNEGGLFSGRTGSLKVTFEVLETWKGFPGRTNIVSTNRGGAICGYNFEEGESYLVFANFADDDLWTSICSNTQRLSDAGDALAILGEGNRYVTPEGGDWNPNRFDRNFYYALVLVFVIIVATVLMIKKKARKVI